MTEEDLREIEDRLRASGNKPVRMVIATLSLDVEKLLAEVRRQASEIARIETNHSVTLADRARIQRELDECRGECADLQQSVNAAPIYIEPNAGGGNLDE